MSNNNTGRTKSPEIESPVCPSPLSKTGRKTLGHGSGGKIMRDLIRDLFLLPLDNPALCASKDAGLSSLALDL